METRRYTTFTRWELIVMVVLIAIIATAGFFTGIGCGPGKKRVAQIRSLSDAKQIALFLRMYAGDHNGNYPAFRNSAAPSPLPIKNSNQALEALMPRYTPEKKYFNNPNSAWCKGPKATASEENKNKVGRYENDWSYVVGLTEINDSRWPLLATAFAPGSGTNPKYVKDPKQRGGVWEGTHAIMIRVDCSASIEETKEVDLASIYMIKRIDSPSKNAFTPDEAWLGGSNSTIHVINPLE